MPIDRSNPFECDHVGCDAMRRTVNHWFVVFSDETGVHAYHWDKAPKEAMDEGYHFCGLSHTINFLSKQLTPEHLPNPARESTLELKPPLNREGKAAE